MIENSGTEDISLTSLIVEERQRSYNSMLLKKKKKKKQDTTGILRKGNLPNFEEGREGLRESISLEEIYKQNSDKG